MRRSLSLLLTLFLLLGQQEALSHVVNHLTRAAVAAADADDDATDPSKQKASACSLCSLAGQYAAALPYSPVFLPATYSPPVLHVSAPASVVRTGTVAGFDSRAPPLA